MFVLCLPQEGNWESCLVFTLMFVYTLTPQLNKSEHKTHSLLIDLRCVILDPSPEGTLFHCSFFLWNQSQGTKSTLSLFTLQHWLFMEIMPPLCSHWLMAGVGTGARCSSLVGLISNRHSGHAPFDLILRGSSSGQTVPPFGHPMSLWGDYLRACVCDSQSVCVCVWQPV